MGWKSTITISRSDAIDAFQGLLRKATDEQLEDLMDRNFGDDVDLPYYGHNFMIKSKSCNCDCE